MTFKNYASYDGLGLAKLVADKHVKPVELVDAAIACIERHNPALNAIIWPLFEQARAAAKRKLPEGIFRGVPFLLKDIRASLKGVPTREGSRLVPPFPSPKTDELTARYLASGLIPMGKTNSPEFGLLPVTESALYGPARNPWHVEHTPGGSSGGSAAAVACGMVPMAHANDGGGSIRIPASCCGLVGLKPTRARNPVPSVTTGLTIDHIISRTVRDTAAMLDVTAGPAPGAPYVAPPAPKSWLAASRKTPPRLRIGFSRTTVDGHALHPECVQAVERAASACRALGHRVEEAAPTISREPFTMAFLTLWASTLARRIDELVMTTGVKPDLESLEGLTLGLYEQGSRITASQYLMAVMHIQQVAREVAEWHQRYDLWLTPTLGGPPLPIGSIDIHEQDPHKAFAPAIDFVPFTSIQNCTGQPAISLPLYWTRAGLPIGVQFAGRHGEEVLLLQLATQLEKAVPWKHQHPPIWD